MEELGHISWVGSPHPTGPGSGSRRRSRDAEARAFSEVPQREQAGQGAAQALRAWARVVSVVWFSPSRGDLSCCGGGWGGVDPGLAGAQGLSSRPGSPAEAASPGEGGRAGLRGRSGPWGSPASARSWLACGTFEGSLAFKPFPGCDAGARSSFQRCCSVRDPLGGSGWLGFSQLICIWKVTERKVAPLPGPCTWRGRPRGALHVQGLCCHPGGDALPQAAAPLPPSLVSALGCS